jgi:hypothetical protein
MSDQLTGGLFESGTFVSPPWWLGRVEAKETWKDNIEAETFTNVAGITGWGHRYKVRVFNWHTGELGDLPPEQMAFCQVIMPVTAGSGHGGASETPSIESGSVVFGFFMDGMAGQDGYIVGVLGNSNNNVPKERGASAPTQTAVAPTATGSVLSSPPTTPAGPGSLSNLPLPPNVDQLSTQQLNKLLNPARTPTTAEFKAVTEAKQKAKSAGLPVAEVERLGQLAAVKSSKQPGASSPNPGNCNLGYQQFNNTFSDSNKSPAYVPDNLNVFGTPLQITEGLHLGTLAWDTQDKDKKVERPLRNACKKDDSDTKGIATVLSNLIKQSNEIARIAGEYSLAASSIQAQLNSIIQAASGFISSYMTNLLNLVLEKLETELTNKLQKEVVPFLFPSEIPTYNNVVSEALELLSCLFKKIIQSLVPTFASLLKNLISNLVSGPICAVQQMIGDFLSPIIGEISSALSSVLGAVGNIAGLVASAFNLLSGILSFFKCDEEQACPDYDKISLAGPAKPAIQVKDFSSGILNELTKATPQSSGGGSTTCNTAPVFCGPPKVNFFGGGGSGAAANPIISNSSSIIGFDIINSGSYTSAPIITLEDPCGSGSGGAFEAIMEPDENNSGKLKIKNILVKSSGQGYLKTPDGSMGGGGFTWKEADEGYIEKSNGTFELVKIGKPVTLTPGDTYYPPNGPPETVSVDYTKYKVNTPQTVASKNRPISLKITNLEGESRKYFGFIENDELSLSTRPNRIVKNGSRISGENIVDNTITILNVGDLGIGTTIFDDLDDDLDLPIIELPLLPVAPINIPVVDDFAIADTLDSDSDDKGKVSYKVVLCIEEIRVIQGGFGYRPEDEIIITPNNGIVAKPTINEYGQITEVKVLNGGCGFNDIPEIKTNSLTGFNALLIPIITVKRLTKDEIFDISEDERDTKVVNVVDCTGCIKCSGGNG